MPRRSRVNQCDSPLRSSAGVLVDFWRVARTTPSNNAAAAAAAAMGTKDSEGGELGGVRDVRLLHYVFLTEPTSTFIHSPILNILSNARRRFFSSSIYHSPSSFDFLTPLFFFFSPSSLFLYGKTVSCRFNQRLCSPAIIIHSREKNI